MSDQDIAGAAMLILISPMLIETILDFWIPGHWQRRAEKNSREEWERRFK